MGAGRPKQVEAVSLRFGQGLFVAEDDIRRVVLDSAECDKPLPLQLLVTARQRELLRVPIN